MVAILRNVWPCAEGPAQANGNGKQCAVCVSCFIRCHMRLDFANQASQCPRGTLSIGISAEARHGKATNPDMPDSFSPPHVKPPLRSFTVDVSKTIVNLHR
jgi:hypothetical protein